MNDNQKYLVSACLAGECCRYDQKATPIPEIIELVKSNKAISFCPECSGGLPTPRVPSERIGDRVINRDGDDVTENFVRGAKEALKLCEDEGIKKAILKQKSPSCGHGLIYDGSFSGTLIPGSGITAEILENAGVEVIDEVRFLEQGE